MDDDAPGVPEWVVTYGDMMSLLLTFFIMLVSLSEVVAEQKYRAILDSLQQYQGYRTGPKAPPGNHFPLNSMISRLETLGSQADHKARGGVKWEGATGREYYVFRLREGRAIEVGGDLYLPRVGPLTEETEHRLAEIARQVKGKPNKVEILAPIYADREDAYLKAYRVLRHLEGLGIEVERLRIDLSEAPPVEPGARRRGISVQLLDIHADEVVGPRDG